MWPVWTQKAQQDVPAVSKDVEGWGCVGVCVCVCVCVCVSNLFNRIKKTYFFLDIYVVVLGGKV